MPYQFNSVLVPWDSQPQEATALDPNYSFIAAVAPLGVGRYLAGNDVSALVPAAYTPTSVLMANGAGQFGPVIVRTALVANYIEVTTTPAISEYSLIAVWRPTSTGVLRYVIDADGGGTSSYRFFQLRLTASGQPEFITFNSSKNPYFATASAIKNQLSPCVMIATVDSTGAMNVYYAERPYNNYRTASGTRIGTPAVSDVVRFFQSMDVLATDPGVGEYSFLGMADKIWSPGELAALLDNPNLVYAPRRISVWMPDVLGGAGRSRVAALMMRYSMWRRAPS